MATEGQIGGGTTYRIDADDAPICHIRLSDMKPGFFWCRFDECGTSAEEMVLISNGRVPPERIEQIRRQTELARNGLESVEPAGCKWWQDRRRNMQ